MALYLCYTCNKYFLLRYTAKQYNMKTIRIALLLVLTAATAAAQENEQVDGKNMIKLNVPALALKNISVQYERAISHRFTAGATVRFMPKGKLPFKSLISKIADDNDVERQLANTEVGNRAIMPEIRWYVGKKGAFRGFYLGAYAHIARSEADLDYEYDDGGITKFIPLSGNINSITGGLQLGAQWKLSKAIYLDWWILGVHGGKSKGDLEGKQSLTASEQQAIRDELDELDRPNDIRYNVDANGATVYYDGPWAGVRAGLCIGIRF